MAIRVVRLGSPRTAGEGLRIGTVRRPPRGVPKKDFSKRDYYDVWLPTLSPSPELLKFGLGASSEGEWKSFVRRYRKEMTGSDAAAVLNVLAALSHDTDFAVGCYCENEDRCHRTILRQLLQDRNAVIRD